MFDHKPFICDRCSARCKTVQGLRGHQRFRHGFHASQTRRFQVVEGQLLAVNGEGLTFEEAMNQVRWDLLFERLDRVEATLRQLTQRIKP